MNADDLSCGQYDAIPKSVPLDANYVMRLRRRME